MAQEDRHRQAFKEEALELLAELETSLLDLESNPDDSELINRVFRAMHTIKGSGAMFGFEDIATFTHEVETVFDLVRNGELEVSKDLLDLTLKARDQILTMLEGDDSGVEGQAQEIISGFSRFLRQKKPAPSAPIEIQAEDSSGEVHKIFRVRFKPDVDIFKSGNNPLWFLQELKILGECKLVGYPDAIPAWAEMDAEGCYFWWDILLMTQKTENDIRDIFLFVEDESDLSIRMVEEQGCSSRDTYKLLGEILVEKGDVSPEDLNRILQAQKPLGELLTQSKLVSEQKIQAALSEQQAVRSLRQGKVVQQEQVSSIRVPATKLDSLVDLVGELVIVQARLAQFVLAVEHDPALDSISEDIERISEELRDSTLDVRMLPIGTSFNRFKRLVRDLSTELEKEVNLQTEGGETELDKTMIERLSDPLVHLLRNSLDHGIEEPEKRLASGKPRQGIVRLSAEHSAGEVVIRVEDDGQGIDPDKILQLGIKRGVVNADHNLSRKEILELIFAPGFSTSNKVSSVSGRGVGMDVVKRNIDALRGRIEIESSPGQGTSMIIYLPLTLAIIDGLQVRIADQYFVLPLAMVEECVELSRSSTEKNQLLQVRGEAVPYIELRNNFNISGHRPSLEQVVIVTYEGQKFGLVVDDVIGEHQTVIKSLGKVYQNIAGISGATIKGDGSMALILDIPDLIRSIKS